MKHLILIFITAMVLGCANAPAPEPTPDPIVNEYGDNAQQAKVRAWITKEVIRIKEKELVITDMLNSGQISYEEYFILMEECSKEMRSIPFVARELFGPK